MLQYFMDSAVTDLPAGFTELGSANEQVTALTVG